MDTGAEDGGNQSRLKRQSKALGPAPLVLAPSPALYHGGRTEERKVSKHLPLFSLCYPSANPNQKERPSVLVLPNFVAGRGLAFAWGMGGDKRSMAASELLWSA